ncbi:hypothetical protein ABZ639_30355 [Saccharomonospora sp. NPDC006951]
MRTRASRVTRGAFSTVFGALAALILLSGCSTEAGPTAKGPADDPGPGALMVKLDALTVDVCFRTPEEIPSPDCQKYVTQLASVPGTAKKFAGTEHPELTEAATALGKGVQAYREGGCESGGDEKACSGALADIASALDKVKSGVAELPEVSAPAS